MKNQQLLTGFLLIGIGSFFLLRQLSIPFISHLYSWPALLMLIGLVFLFYSYLSRDYEQLFSGAFLLGIGIHLYGRTYYTYWIEHWAIYPLIISLAFLLQFSKTRTGLIPGLLLMAVALTGAFFFQSFFLFDQMARIILFFETYWPLVLIIFGCYLLFRNKKTAKKKQIKL